MTPENRLGEETSPYLLQHADNPVHWLPWGPEALERAKEDDRPILLSIGYSSCHWCHVMERESFSDPAVARIQNDHFVNVKVDREERPDVDRIYMQAVQAMTGRGGWPLTVFLTPGGVPFYGGTYFPPEPRHGMPSFRQVMEGVLRAWETKREEVEDSASEIRRALGRMTAGEAGSISDEGIEKAIRRVVANFDPVHGGVQGAPKFPQPMVLEALLAAGEDSVVEHTLTAMARGGIRDHLAGGYHRYATDARWLVPHFEKMLCDNGLLAGVLLDAWRATGNRELRDEVEATLDWLLAEMRAPEGGFYAALDADTEGEEGRFYVWSAEEIRRVLGDAAEAFERTFGVRDGGNWEGTNILHRVDDGEHPEAVDALLEVRNRRERPFRDTKVLASWNGMALRNFARAGAALGRDDYLEVARREMAGLLELLRVDGRLHHQHVDGVPAIPGFLEDVAALGLAALDLHQVTLEGRWLREAEACAREVLECFLDPETDLLMDTADDDLIVRPRETTDNAVPSGNALAAELLFRLGRILGRQEWIERAEGIVSRQWGSIVRAPHGFGRLLTLAIPMRAEPVEVAILGDPADPATRALLDAALEKARPGMVIAGGDDPPESPLFEGRGPIGGKPAAWVCRAYSCQAPVTEPDALDVDR